MRVIPKLNILPEAQRELWPLLDMIPLKII